jgi:hypothetical protein
MTGSRLQWLVLALCACSVGPALAGSGDITKRDQNSGSVELSNLGDEDAPVVVSAPARPVIQAAVKPAPSAVSAPPAREAVAAERPADAQQPRKRKSDKDEEEVANGEGGERGERAGGAGEYGSYNRDAYAANGGSSGVYGYGGGGMGTGSGSTVYDTGSSGSSTGNASGGSTSGSGSYGGTTTGGSTSGSTGGSSSGAPYFGATEGAGSAPSAGLSPELLALRVAQYREAMLNEQRGANGLVANPAVQRRYLMINRAGYMGLGY